MTENQNNMEFLEKNDLKEIEIEEVEKLLDIIGDNNLDYSNYNFDNLDGEAGKVKGYEVIIMQKLSEIEKIKQQKDFIKELLSVVKKTKGEDIIESISDDSIDGIIVDNINRSYNKSELIEKMNEGKSSVNNEYIQQYIENEASRLKGGGKINNWTFLMLTYIEKQENIIADLFSGTHNEVQDNYIKNILGNDGGSNKYFIKGYNNEVSNYLIKISDFEEYLARNETKIDGANDDTNTVNSLALANYINHLIETGASYEDFISKFGFSKLRELNKLWFEKGKSGNGVMIAKEKLKSSEVWSELKNIMEKQNKTGDLMGEIDKYTQEINNKDNKYLSKNLDLIYSIGANGVENINNDDGSYYAKSVNKMNSIINMAEDEIYINDINPNIREHFILHPKVKIGLFEMQNIDENFLINNFEKFIEKDQNTNNGALSGFMAFKVATMGYDKELLSQTIKKYNIKIDNHLDYVKVYIGEYDVIERDTFIEKYNEVKKLDNINDISYEDKEILTKYLLRTHNNVESQNMIEHLTKNNFYGTSSEFMKLPTVNIKIIKNILDNNLGQFPLLTQEARGNSEVILYFLQKVKENNNNSQDIINTAFSFSYYMDLLDINNFLSFFKFIDENSDYGNGGIENLPLKFKAEILNEKYKSQLIEVISNGMNDNINKENIPIFLKIFDIIDEDKDVILNIEYRDNIRSSGMEYEESEEELKLSQNQKTKERESLFSNISNVVREKYKDRDIDIDEKLKSIESINNKIIKEGFSSDLINILYMTINETFEDKDIIKDIFDTFIKEIEEFKFHETIQSGQEAEKLINESTNNNFTPNNEYQKDYLETINSEISEKEKIIKIKELFKESTNDIYDEIDTEGKTKEEIEELLKSTFIDKLTQGLYNKEAIKLLLADYLKDISDLTEIVAISAETDNYIEYAKKSANGDIEEGTNFDDYLKSIGKDTDKIFENRINNIEYKNDYFQNLNEKNISNNIKENEFANKKKFINYDIYSNKGYNHESGVIENNGNKIELSNKEKQIVESSPEALDNIINFYSMLDDVGLSKLWSIKDKIFNSIANVEGIGFNVDGDYLNQNEVKIFFNSILKSLDLEEIPTTYDIKDFKGELLSINKTQVSGNQERDFIYGETYLEYMFIERYYPRGSTLELLNSEFENAIK